MCRRTPTLRGERQGDFCTEYRQMCRTKSGKITSTSCFMDIFFDTVKVAKDNPHTPLTTMVQGCDTLPLRCKYF